MDSSTLLEHDLGTRRSETRTSRCGRQEETPPAADVDDAISDGYSFYSDDFGDDQSNEDDKSI